MLDILYGLLLQVTEQQSNLDLILQSSAIEAFRSKNVVQCTDQEIDDFINTKNISKEKKDLIVSVIRKIKVEQYINNIDNSAQLQEDTQVTEIVNNIFSEIAEPANISINNNYITVTVPFEEKSKLMKKIKSIEMWNKENVKETMSSYIGIPLDNIVLIDSVNSYIDFISEFEENNYVSRGQKDCTYKLVPSLYRLYEEGYVGHASKYESSFKQKIIYYDDTVEKKNNEEIRAYGQHFGLPTNYLDFTEAHLISLLFAVEEYEYIENHSIVYFVDAKSYNQDMIRTEEKLVDFSDENLRESIQRKYSDKSFFIRVGNCNERIHFQKGCFLKVEPGDSLEQMLAQYTKIAIIDKNHKEDILKELFKLGITFENIYPDKDNMVKTIRFIKEHM
ncbi:FRG domain-containing protein [Firmicutes bacterium AM43-11BH]|nr:FRG domain-containing protein [Firmicutes bacterium AM43-11BH]